MKNKIHEGLNENPGNTIVLIKQECIPNGFSNQEYIDNLRKELINSGFSDDLIVKLYTD